MPVSIMPILMPLPVIPFLCIALTPVIECAVGGMTNSVDGKCSAIGTSLSTKSSNSFMFDRSMLNGLLVALLPSNGERRCSLVNPDR
ncbi:hypothetical protein BDF22DRAFT_700022 [Syncephalis plumigaleata]|nr:hypothetical protein BDF22DRAFT_700022 [Syncephalis plumigaleata]